MKILIAIESLKMKLLWLIVRLDIGIFSFLLIAAKSKQLRADR